MSNELTPTTGMTCTFGSGKTVWEIIKVNLKADGTINDLHLSKYLGDGYVNRWAQPDEIRNLKPQELRVSLALILEHREAAEKAVKALEAAIRTKVKPDSLTAHINKAKTEASNYGTERGNFGTFMNADQCTVRRALAVRDLYDQIWNQPQTGTEWHSKTAATKARNHAAARGWLPPLAWDDDTIDNPDAEPDLGHKPKLRDTIADDVEFMRKTGASLDEISKRLRSPWGPIERQLHRIGRGDLVTLVKTDNRDNARQGRKGHRAA